MKHILALVLIVFVGGFIGYGASIDKDFNSIDVCLVMDTQNMSDKYKKIYLYHTKLKELTTFKQVNGKQVTDLCHRK